MAYLFTAGRFQAEDNSGVPLSGGLVYTYAAGTLTPLATYTNQGGGTANANPVVLDSGGRASIWLGTSAYRIIVKTSAGVTISDDDNITVAAAANLTTTLADTTSAATGAGQVGYNKSLAYAAGTVGGKLIETLSVKDYGADLTGAADCSTAFASTNTAAAEVIITAGTYKVSANVTFTKPVRILPGALLNIATGVTVAFNGGFSAGIYQCWALTGSAAVTFDASKTRAGYAEWWGAVANVSTGGTPAANPTAINAAIVALGKVELMPSDYYISTIINHNTANSWLCGSGGQYDSAYGLRATRVLMTNGTSDIIQIGPSSNPGGIGLFVQNIRVTGIFFARTVAPAVTSASTSVRIQYVLEAFLEDVKAYDSVQGFQFNGTVHCILQNCTAARQSAGTGGTDLWKGFYINGGSGIAAGGNASLYLMWCHADDNRTVKTNSVGFFADQKFTDLFILHCETVSCTVGIEINGNSAVTNDLGNTDLTILHPIMDGFAQYGIYIHNLGYGGSAEVVAPYCGAAAGATSSIQIANCADSAINIIGGQLPMGSASGCKGITLDTSNGVSILGTIISEAGTNGAVVVSNINRCKIEPVVLNRVTTGGPAVQVLNTCTANTFAATVNGKASGVTFGYQVLGTADARNEYNCSGIDSAVVAGGSGNKLVRNGVQIVATGLTGTNLASGVMT